MMTHQKPFYDTLFDSIKSTIEEMGFLEVELSPTEINTSTLECVSIQVIKPFWGKIYFFFAPEIKYQIVQNLYAKEVVAEKEAQDAILEVLNVIVGRFLSNLTEGKDYEMEFPTWEYENPYFKNIIADISLRIQDSEGRFFVIKETM